MYPSGFGASMADRGGEMNEEILHQMYERLEKIVELLSKQNDLLAAQTEYHWYCGCGHWNGVNLATCADCGRKPGER